MTKSTYLIPGSLVLAASGLIYLYSTTEGEIEKEADPIFLSLEAEAKDEEGKTVPHVTYLKRVTAPVGDDHKLGLRDLSTEVRGRVGRTTDECIAITIEEGNEHPTKWTIVERIKILPSNPCRDGDRACLRPMSECNEGIQAIAGYTQRILVAGDGEKIKQKLAPEKWGICTGDMCICSTPPCITDAPTAVHTGSSTWQERLCAQYPTHDKCTEELER